MLLDGVYRKDPAMAESLLGVLYGRQLISRPLYEAGYFFGVLGYRYEPCLGHKFRPNVSSLYFKKINSQGDSPLQWPDAQDEKRTIAWNKALNALKKSGAESYKVVLEVVFYDHDLYTVPFPRFVVDFVQPLRKGLESLESYFKGELQDKRGKPYDPVLNLRQSTRFQPASIGLQSSCPPSFPGKEHPLL